MKKIIVLVIANLAWASFAEAQVCQSVQPKSLLGDIKFRQPVPFYQSLLNRCQGYIDDLLKAKASANMIAKTGQLKLAADKMQQAIEEKAASLPPPFSSEFYPHTVEAIRTAADIAVNVSSAAWAGQYELGPQLTAQVRYLAIVRAIEMVHMSYEQLDAHYMYSVNTCYYGCDTFNALPMQYYQGVKKLALGYLYYQLQQGPMMAHDTVELAVAQVITKAAKESLARSMFRRELACAVTALHNLEMKIGEYLCGDTIPSEWEVDQVRGGLNEAVYQINALSFGQGCY